MRMCRPYFLTARATTPSGWRVPIVSLVTFCIVIAYSCLTIAAASCIPDLLSAVAGHHHAHHGLTHAPLCAWACHANASPSLTTSAPTGTILPLSAENVTQLPT